MIGAGIGCLMGVLLVLMHPIGSYVAEEIIGVVLTLVGAVIGSEGLDR